MRRREFMALPAAAAAGRAGASGWDTVPEILRRIRPPRFAAREFPVTSFGAAGDGARDCREAFAKAIARCNAAGGGRVTVPAGRYLSNGPIHLESNVELHLDEGAKVVFGTNPADYLPLVPVRWEGTRLFNYSPLIYARGRENIAVTGCGIIDGQTSMFWHAWKGKQTPAQEASREMNAKGTELARRVFGEGHFLRPTLVEPYECRNVLINGVTFQGSPFWTIHPVFCRNVTVRDVRVRAGTTNDDGCNPDSCRDVLIENCVFETEDNIAIKAGRDRDAWDLAPCENIVVRGCTGARTKANGFCIGSEMSGGVRNVFIENCKVGEAANGLCIKANSDRGGAVENVRVRGVAVGECDCAIRLETDYKGVVGHPYPPLYRDFHFENVKCGKARKTAIYSVGIAAKPIEGVYLDNVEVGEAGEAARFAHTSGIHLRGVRVNGKPLAERRVTG